MANTTHEDSWILIGGTGQDFGLAAATLALLGVVPVPRQVILVDADRKGDLFNDLRAALDVVRYRRFADEKDRESLVSVAPLQPARDGAEQSLAGAYPGDRGLAVLYSSRQRGLDTRDGFKAEPQLGSATLFGSALAPDSTFRKTLQRLTGSGRQRIWIVASVAGGTGAGLWQLVARLVHEVVSAADIRLILMGPLMALGDTRERDADGNFLTDARLEANAAAGFQQVREAVRRLEPMGPGQRPFSVVHLLGYHPNLARPGAPEDRTARRHSRLVLAAVSALTSDLEPPERGARIGLMADDIRPGSMMPGLFFRPPGAHGGVLPAVSIGSLAAQTRAMIQALDRAPLDRLSAWWTPFRRTALGAALFDAWQGGGADFGQWRRVLKDLTSQLDGLLGRFQDWLTNDTGVYPRKIEAATGVPGIVQARTWQQALAAQPSDPTSAENVDFHCRRWLTGIGATLLVGGTKPSHSGAAEWLIPFDTGREVLRESDQVGWHGIDPAHLNLPFCPRAASFPTPFARAQWTHQNLRADLGNSRVEAEARYAVNRQGQALWRGLVAGLLRVKTVEVPRIDVVGGAASHTLVDVCAYVEQEHLGHTESGVTPVAFLELSERVGDCPAGTWIGAVHPLVGPFLGPDYTGLVEPLHTAACRRPEVAGILEYWRRSVGPPQGQAGPPWFAAIPVHDEAVNPADYLCEPLQLPLGTGGAPVLPVPTFVGSPRVLAFLRPDTEMSPSMRVASCLPVTSLGKAQSFLEHPAAAKCDFLVPTFDGGSLKYTGLPGEVGERTYPVSLEELVNWTIEVWPGERAPKEWTGFALSIEPGDVGDLARFEVDVYVDKGQGLQRQSLTNRLRDAAEPDDGTVQQVWVDGRPRLLYLRNIETGTIGFFRLLGPAGSSRTRTDATSHVAIDLGTSRTSVMVARDGLEGGAFGNDQIHVVTSVSKPEDENPYYANRGSAWHPLRHLPKGGGIADAVGRLGGGYRAVLLPSTLLQRKRSVSLPDAERMPLVSFTVPGVSLPRPTLFEVSNDLKWSASLADLADYLLLALLTAVAELDVGTDAPPAEIELYCSYPMAFEFAHRVKLEQAIDRARARLKAIAGIRVTSVAFCDEAAAAVRGAGKPDSGSDDDWRFIVDLGGGSLDLALIFRNKTVATDSVHFGGDLVMRRYAELSFLTEAHPLLMVRNALMKDTFETYFAAQGRRLTDAFAAQAIGLTSEYASRLLAGVLHNLLAGNAPEWLTEDPQLWEQVKRNLEERRSLRMPIYLIGGGWRLAGLVKELRWGQFEDARIQRSLGGLIQEAVNRHLAPPTDFMVEIVVQHRHLHDNAGEKLAVVAGLMGLGRNRANGLEGSPLRPVMASDASGLKTINGVDETFDGQERRWHTWISGEHHPWRPEGAGPEFSRNLSQVHPRPTFSTEELQQPGWRLKDALVSHGQRLADLLTPQGRPHEEVYINHRFRRRGALACIYREAFATLYPFKDE